MVTLSHPYRTLASHGGADQGDSAGPTRAQSGRSVDVERPFRPVGGVSLGSFYDHFERPLSQIGFPKGGTTRVGSRGRLALKVVVLLM